MSLQKQVANARKRSSPPFTEEPKPPVLPGMIIIFWLASVATVMSLLLFPFLIVADIFL